MIFKDSHMTYPLILQNLLRFLPVAMYGIDVQIWCKCRSYDPSLDRSIVDNGLHLGYPFRTIVLLVDY